MKSVVLFMALASAVPLAPAARAQAEGEAFRLVVTYDRPGLSIPHWQLTVPPRGAAEYTGKPDKGNDPGQVLFPLSSTGRAKLAAWLSHSKNLQPCETKAKNLANMGSKTVRYTPASGAEVQCTFNYTDNKSLSEMMDYTMAVVNTVQTGLELDRLHRFDRLGLDPVMIHLAEDVKAGRAAEVGAIRPTLQSLITDDALLDRVRAKAQQLLELAKQESGTP